MGLGRCIPRQFRWPIAYLSVPVRTQAPIKSGHRAAQFGKKTKPADLPLSSALVILNTCKFSRSVEALSPGPSATAILVFLFMGAGFSSVQNLAAQSSMGAVTAASNLKVAKDFKVELLYTVPKDKEGSWVAMCVDPKGRLIVSDQYGKLYRIMPPPIGSNGPIKPEPMDLAIGKAHGLLYAFDSLYVMVNEDRQAPRPLPCARHQRR